MINWLKQLLGVPEQKKSSQIARERLMVIVAHERGEHETQPDFLPLLQKELTDVIAKYVKIDKEQVQVEFEQKGGRSVLELNITLPDGELKKAAKMQLNKVEHKPVVKAAAVKKASAASAPKRRGRPAKVKVKE
jgi:cell division topological specificity factor